MFYANVISLCGRDLSILGFGVPKEMIPMDTKDRHLEPTGPLRKYSDNQAQPICI